MSGKVGTSGNKIVSPKGSFLWWRSYIPSSRTIAYIIYKESGICQVSKQQHMYELGLKWIFFSNLNEKFQKNKP